MARNEPDHRRNLVQPFCRRLIAAPTDPLNLIRVSIVRYRELRRRCDSHVRTLAEVGGIPDPFTLDEFMARLSARRGRRIVLHPTDYVTGAACGMWLRLSDIDIIVYARTALLHQEHIVLHEVAHMLGEHRGQTGLNDVVRRDLMPDLDPATVQSILNRGSYTDAEEQEAELLATLILERVADRRPGRSTDLDVDLAPEIDRLKSTFSG
jgi:hypothetical protein